VATNTIPNSQMKTMTSPPWKVGELAGRTGMSVEELTSMLNVDSGLQGLSGVSNDMRTVSGAAADGNARAQLALDVFVHRLSKAIAGLVVGLQRIDALVFTGGIGENSALVRSLVLSRLGFLGLAIDTNRNDTVHGDGDITAAGTSVRTVVVTAREDLQIAGEARLVHGTP